MGFEFLNLSFTDKGKIANFNFNNEKYFSVSEIWRVNFKKDGKDFSFGIDECSDFNKKIRENCLILSWENEDFEVEVNIWENNNKIAGNIAVNSKNEFNKIKSVAFPIISGLQTIKQTDDDCLLLPYQNGWTIYNPTSEFLKNIDESKIPFWLGRGGDKYEAEYPASLNFQFTSYSSNNIGCYIASDDPDVHIKTFRYLLKGDNFIFEMENYPEGMGKTTSYCMPYSFLFSFYCGGWQESVDIYRRWALKQKWCKKSLAEKGIKDNILNTDLWRINHTNYSLGTRTEEYFESSKAIKNKLGCNLGLHWYGWNMGEHDVNYPQYISDEKLQENWDNKLKNWNNAFAKEKIVRIPYVNARLWDQYSTVWDSENAEISALKDENGEVYYEPWKGDRLIPMCPATYQWQKKVVDFSSKYINDYLFDGIYLDQIASFNATLCFDEGHPHPVGGGTWWNDNYHDMINSIRNNIGNEKILTSESCCETYVDVLDMFLILDTNISYKAFFNILLEKSYAEPIPLFNMIYGNHSLSYGSVCRKSDPVKLFEYKFIRNILWGFIPTIESFSMEELNAPDMEEYYKIILEGVEFFKKNKLKLLYGRICKIPKINCDVIKIPLDSFGNNFMELPEIIGVLWESPDGKNEYILYNTSSEEKCFLIDKTHLKLLPKHITVVDLQ